MPTTIKFTPQSIKFEPSESLPLFETSEGPSLISKLRDLKRINKPLALLRAKWFALKSYENEPFAAWDERVVNLVKEANLNAILKGERPVDAMIGFKLVAGLTGTKGDIIRNRVFCSDKIRDGIIFPEIVRQIAQSEDRVMAFSQL